MYVNEKEWEQGALASSRVMDSSQQMHNNGPIELAIIIHIIYIYLWWIFLYPFNKCQNSSWAYGRILTMPRTDLKNYYFILKKYILTANNLNEYYNK